MKNSAVWELIQHYVTGSISPDEHSRLKQWMNEDPLNRQIVKEVEKIWKFSPDEDFEVNTQEAWEQFIQQKKRPEKINNRSLPERPRHFNRHIYFFRAAAIILVILLAGFFTHEYLAKKDARDEVAQVNVMQDLVTEKGEKARVTFSDGTQVTLNAAGSLRFPKTFQGPRREIYLDGEAYFKVQEADRPFIVHLQNIEVRVLGTAFNIRGWSGDENVDVAVREGKVSVKATQSTSDKAEVVLTQGQFTRVKSGEDPLPPGNVDINNHLLWTAGGMHFDNVPFKQVLQDIERKFDVQITVKDTMALQVPFTGTFIQAELYEILEVIAEAMKMEYHREGSKVIFI